MLSSQQSKNNQAQERLIADINTEMDSLESELLQLTQSSLITLSAERQYEALSRLDTDQDPWDINRHFLYHNHLSGSPYSFDEEYKKTGSELSEMRLEAVRYKLGSIFLTGVLTLLVLVVTIFTAGIGIAAIAAGAIYLVEAGSTTILARRLENSVAEKQEELQSLEKKIDTKLINMTGGHEMNQVYDITQEHDMTQEHEHVHKPKLDQEISLRKNSQHRTSKLSANLPYHDKVLDILKQVKAETV